MMKREEGNEIDGNGFALQGGGNFTLLFLGGAQRHAFEPAASTIRPRRKAKGRDLQENGSHRPTCRENQP